MKDRELLELAAKAIGILVINDPHGKPRNCTDMHPLSNVFAAPFWNPLTDDGDALRLAVKLNICVDQKQDAIDAWNYSHRVSSGLIPIDADPYAATRRAIVRAAAEIGASL